MTTFEYTTGNIDNLVPGADADMNDIQGPFIDIREFLNSGLLDDVAHARPMIGEVRFIAVLSAPSLWLPCDGSAVSRGTYYQLFAAIQEIYGKGDSSTTFNVPDLRGRMPLGSGKADGTGTQRTPGQKVGAETVALNGTQMPNHSHGGATGDDSPDHGHSGWTDGQGQHHHNWSRPIGYSIIPFNGTIAFLLAQDVGMGWSGDITSDDGFHSHNVGTYGANARHRHGINPEGGNAAHDNMAPALCIPAYIFAGA